MQLETLAKILLKNCVFFAGSLSTEQPDEKKTQNSADETRHPQPPTGGFQDEEHHALHAVREQSVKDAFHKHEQGDGQQKQVQNCLSPTKKGLRISFRRPWLLMPYQSAGR